MGEDLQRADMIKTLFGDDKTQVLMLARGEMEETVWREVRVVVKGV